MWLLLGFGVKFGQRLFETNWGNMIVSLNVIRWYVSKDFLTIIGVNHT